MGGSTLIPATAITPSIVNYPKLNTQQLSMAGFGQVGENLSQATSGYFNTPPTVTVKAGVGLGILFMSDVSNPTSAQNTTPASTEQEKTNENNKQTR